MPSLDLGPGPTLLCDCGQDTLCLWAYAVLWEKAGAGMGASGCRKPGVAGPERPPSWLRLPHPLSGELQLA